MPERGLSDGFADVDLIEAPQARQLLYMAKEDAAPRGLTTGQLCALLGVPEYRINALLRCGVIERPPLVHARSRLWPPDLVEAVRVELLRRGAVRDAGTPDDPAEQGGSDA